MGTTGAWVTGKIAHMPVLWPGFAALDQRLEPAEVDGVPSAGLGTCIQYACVDSLSNLSTRDWGLGIMGATQVTKGGAARDRAHQRGAREARPEAAAGARGGGRLP